MIEAKTILSRDDRTFLDSAQSHADRADRQRRMMASALGLLVIGLAGVLYVERDFWFSHEEQAQTQSALATPVATTTQKHGAASHKKKHSTARLNEAVDAGDGSAIIATRTVLPPLQVEVIASTYRRTIHPASNSVMVDLRDGSTTSNPMAAGPSDAIRTDSPETAANITSNAAGRAEVSSLTSDVVTHSVVPDYPMLARQMKVQGSVILEAMIGRDGLIQDLHVLSGPPILAGAAQEAVKQWHFRPHYQGADPVETQTKITVNFTISTN